MKIYVHDVEAHVGRTCYTKHRVQVCAVIIHQSTGGMYKLRYLRDVFLEQTEGVGVRHHHRRKVILVLLHDRTKVVEIHKTVLRALDLKDLKATDSRGGRIGAVGRVWYDDFYASFIATRLMIAADYHQTGELSMSTGTRI